MIISWRYWFNLDKNKVHSWRLFPEKEKTKKTHMIWKKFHCIQFMVVYQTRTDLLLPKVPLNLRFKILKEKLKFSISFSIRDISWLMPTPCSKSNNFQISRTILLLKIKLCTCSSLYLYSRWIIHVLKILTDKTLTKLMRDTVGLIIQTSKKTFALLEIR